MIKIAKPVLIITCFVLFVSIVTGVNRLTNEKYNELLEKIKQFVKALLPVRPSAMSEEDCVKSYRDFYVGLYLVADALELKVQNENMDILQDGLVLQILEEKINFLNITCPLRTFGRYDDKCLAAKKISTCIKIFLGVDY